MTHAELKHASVRGGLVTFAAQFIKFILNMAVTIWLARILLPEDFGLVAMVMIIVNFFVLFKDAGFSTATIQQESVSHEQVSLLFWLSVVIGLALGTILYFIAPGIALFFHEPRLVELVQVLSLLFYIGGLSVQHESLMIRQMRFRGLAAIEISGLVLAAIAAVTLAEYGAGYWALVWMQVIAIVVRVILIWLTAGWIPSPPELKVGVRKMAVFGSQLTFANMLQYLSRQSDQVLLGWGSGAYALGLYATAMQMLVLPMHQILSPLTRVAVATLSRVQSNDSEFRYVYLKLVKIVAYTLMPLMMILAVLAEPIVGLLLGEKWLEMVPIVMVLACVGWILPVNNTMGWILTARGDGRRALIWNIKMAPLMVTVFMISLPWGALGMAVGFAVVIYVSRYFHFRYALAGTSISMYDLLQALSWPAGLSLLLALAAFLTMQASMTPYSWFTLLISLLVVTLVLLTCCLWVKPIRRDCQEVWRLLQSLSSKTEG